jgi:hypothetical protein
MKAASKSKPTPGAKPTRDPDKYSRALLQASAYLQTAIDLAGDALEDAGADSMLVAKTHGAEIAARHAKGADR